MLSLLTLIFICIKLIIFSCPQVTSISKNKLQLVGVTAMLIASKYEEMYAPEVRDFVYITDNTYSTMDIKAMEREMLKTLDYSFGNPLCLHFLRRNSRAGDVSTYMSLSPSLSLFLFLPLFLLSSLSLFSLPPSLSFFLPPFLLSSLSLFSLPPSLSFSLPSSFPPSLFLPPSLSLLVNFLSLLSFLS